MTSNGRFCLSLQPAVDQLYLEHQDHTNPKEWAWPDINCTISSDL
jgi:hypothetical protein